MYMSQGDLVSFSLLLPGGLLICFGFQFLFQCSLNKWSCELMKIYNQVRLLLKHRLAYCAFMHFL